MSRDAYSDYSTFQQRKLGNCFYNLAKQKYDLALTLTIDSQIKKEKYVMSIINAKCALLFNRNDVEAKELIKTICGSNINVYFINSANITRDGVLTKEFLKEIHQLAVTKYRNLGYC